MEGSVPHGNSWPNLVAGVMAILRSGRTSGVSFPELIPGAGLKGHSKEEASLGQSLRDLLSLKPPSPWDQKQLSRPSGLVTVLEGGQK